MTSKPIRPIFVQKTGFDMYQSNGFELTEETPKPAPYTPSDKSPPCCPQKRVREAIVRERFAKTARDSHRRGSEGQRR